jgi:hypothetical protein
MIRFTRDSIALGDTFSLAWDLPPGAKILRGPQASDSLFVSPDSAIPGLWRLQPLSVASYGGDTLRAIGPTGDTLTESVPTWAVHPKVQGSDSAAASLLPPESVKVPFPWDYAGIAGGSVAAALLAIYAWKRYQAWKLSRLPPPPPPPPRDPVEVARERLQELIESSRAGRPARETAFACGELLRQLHGTLHDWTESVESTSFEWKQWCRRHRPTDEQIALEGFLAEADLLRYADATHDAEHLLDKALVLLDAQSRLRNEKP